MREGEGEGSRLVALFLHDNFARSGKASGAWMSEFRSQSRNVNTYEYTSCAADGAVGIRATASGGEQIPVVINNNNFAKSEPCLLSFDDAITLCAFRGPDPRTSGL